ncbi:hypothetical protein CMV_014042 [Castanea mollissima]|uniref:Uncharacterized protein n=1 Tax=Castanea mollissima TaxID=60419 RepID=A0A8J4VLB0_9ROSI|nr:hypothetical protein CMV_014042 [Castanea mollissima]
MEHVISMEEIHSRKVERREAGEASIGHDQPVSVVVATEKLSITIHENEIYSTSFEKENFKKLKEAQVKGKNRWTTKPKIQKVLLLRDHKHFEKYCEPRVVSIGPIHHGKPKYRLSEEYKLTLAENFIEESGKTGKELYMVIKNNIDQLRKFFDEEVIHNYNDEALSWMLFVDGCATLKFIDSVVHNNVKRFQIKNGQVAFVQQDLFLLENQLPYRILDDLIKNSKEGKKLRESVQRFIDKQKDWNSFRNVQELKAVGIHLKSSNDNCLRNITFIKKGNFYGGTLSLPPIIVDDSTGPKFFNLIAYEMCPDFENDYGVTSYISFLDSLIDEAKDVIDLRKEGILRNLLGSDEEVALVFNEIGTDLVPNPEIYRDVRSNIQKYHEKKRMTYINEVIHNHFSSPWTVVAFTAALFALILSIAQTVYSILAYYQ